MSPSVIVPTNSSSETTKVIWRCEPSRFLTASPTVAAESSRVTRQSFRPKFPVIDYSLDGSPRRSALRRTSNSLGRWLSELSPFTLSFCPWSATDSRKGSLVQLERLVTELGEDIGIFKSITSPMVDVGGMTGPVPSSGIVAARGHLNSVSSRGDQQSAS